MVSSSSPAPVTPTPSTPSPRADASDISLSQRHTHVDMIVEYRTRSPALTSRSMVEANPDRSQPLGSSSTRRAVKRD